MHDSQNIEKNQLFHVQYLSMVWQQEIKKKQLLNQKTEIKRRQNEIQPQGTWTFVTGLHKQMGSVILAILFFTKVEVFWTHTSKMVTTSFNAYVMTNT